jgi:hypothetical protein
VNIKIQADGQTYRIKHGAKNLKVSSEKIERIRASFLL